MAIFVLVDSRRRYLIIELQAFSCSGELKMQDLKIMDLKTRKPCYRKDDRR